MGEGDMRRQVTRQEIFEQAAKKLRQEFEELTTLHHSGLKGGEAERLIHNFLRNHIPRRFDVTGGLILDPNDQVSRQTDVIIYDALNCPAYRTSDTAAIIPSDNVAAVVEVKSVLNKDEMRDAFEKAAVIKGLAKTTPPKAPMLITCRSLCFLFAFESPLTLDKLAEHYHAFVCEFGVGRHIDMIMLLDRGVIMLAAKPSGGTLGWAPAMLEGFGGAAGEGAHIAVSAAETTDSLDVFFRFLLSHLIFFRGLVGHPGFWTKDPQPMMKLTYVMSVTQEQDPTLRAEKLERYKQQVIAEFQSTTPQAPIASTESRPAADAPDVIHLPPLPPLET
jgi:hypothetical protein